MEFCKHCLNGECTQHKWFNELKPHTDIDVLIAELDHVLKCDIIRTVVENIYLIEHQYNNYSHYFFSYVSGNMTYKIQIPTVTKKDGVYIPVQCYSGKDDVLNYQIEIKVELLRHNPIELIVRKSIFDDTPLHQIELLTFNEGLHIENIEDCRIIIKHANSRLYESIEQIRQNVKGVEVPHE